jgi:predicted nuclease with TOPRIM domain
MNEQSVVALVGVFLGGIGVKAVDHYFQGLSKKAEDKKVSSVREIDDSVAIRAELREDVAKLKIEVQDLYKRLEDERNKYFELQDMHQKLKLQYDDLDDKYNDLKRKVDKQNKGDL